MPYGQFALWLVVGGCAAFFAYGARAEGKPEWLWAGLSLAASLVARLGLGGGLFLILLSQVLVFAGITAWNAWRDRHELEGKDGKGGGSAGP